MREFWSISLNFWQPIAQTLRFDCAQKAGIIVKLGIYCPPWVGDPIVNPVYNIYRTGRQFMADKVVTLRLNQQQLELMDRTIAQGVAADRVELVRLALREYAAAHHGEKESRR
jgi:hypothetical protein